MYNNIQTYIVELNTNNIFIHFIGVWFVHCHIEDHVPWGLNMAFEVENGPTSSTSLPPPPSDLPKC